MTIEDVISIQTLIVLSDEPLTIRFSSNCTQDTPERIQGNIATTKINTAIQKMPLLQKKHNTGQKTLITNKLIYMIIN